MWANRSPSAPWAGRAGHTTVIDAAGAIYVLGGTNSTYFFNDGWVTTDGGADPGSGGVLGGCSRGPRGYAGVHRGAQGSIYGALKR
jgi:hypothetical protein